MSDDFKQREHSVVFKLQILWDCNITRENLNRKVKSALFFTANYYTMLII